MSDQPKRTTGEPRCNLCETGFPLNKHGNHIPTQSLGMIPVTRCRKLPPATCEWTIRTIDEWVRLNPSTWRGVLAFEHNAELAAEREKVVRLSQQANHSMDKQEQQIQQLRSQLARTKELLDEAVRLNGENLRKLASAQAAIASIPKSFGGAGEAYGILANLKAKFKDTTALDAAIAEAVKKAEVLWRKGWHECDICRTQWFISVDGIIGCPVCQDKRVAAAQQPLVDALNELLETSRDVTPGVFPTEAHLQARRKAVALANIEKP